MRIKVGKSRFAEISEEDYELVSRYNWRFHSSGYAFTTFNGKSFLMHRLIMGFPDNFFVDHVNQKGLDNRRENLRIATQAQNHWNFKIKKNKVGATFSKDGKRKKRWVSTIRVQGQKKFLGRFLTKEEAVDAYKKAAQEFHEEFSPY